MPVVLTSGSFVGDAVVVPPEMATAYLSEHVVYLGRHYQVGHARCCVI